MVVWVIGSSDQLFGRGFYTRVKFSNKQTKKKQTKKQMSFCTPYCFFNLTEVETLK